MSLIGFGDSPTPYDLRFTLLRIPVRVQPLFWLTLLIICYDEKAKLLAVRIPAAALSILIHEYGHALMMRWFGGRPHIVLYVMGGYAQQSGRQYDWIEKPVGRLTEDLSITLAGPLAPVIVSAAIALVMVPLGAAFQAQPMFGMPFFYVFFDAPPSWKAGEMLIEFVQFFINITLFWSFFNVLPIWPLDGGQMTRAILRYRNTPRHEEMTCWISIVTALVTIALPLFLPGGKTVGAVPNAMFLLMLAGYNYQQAQQYRQRGNF